MDDMVAERAAFDRRQKNRKNLAAERASCLLVAGVDLDRVMVLPAAERLESCRKLRRLLERERLKGVRGHWSYDLNRHIALKRALDRLAASIGCAGFGTLTASRA